jgi:hypothetical protein
LTIQHWRTGRGLGGPLDRATLALVLCRLVSEF